MQGSCALATKGCIWKESVRERAGMQIYPPHAIDDTRSEPSHAKVPFLSYLPTHALQCEKAVPHAFIDTQGAPAVVCVRRLDMVACASQSKGASTVLNGGGKEWTTRVWQGTDRAMKEPKGN